MTMLLVAALISAQQTPPAPPTAPVPPTMEVARARVASIKAMQAAIAAGDEAALLKTAAPDATADVNGVTGSFRLAALAPLKSCTRTRPFEVNPVSVVLTMTCTGALPAETTTEVVFTGDKISKVVAARTVFVAPAPQQDSR